MLLLKCNILTNGNKILPRHMLGAYASTQQMANTGKQTLAKEQQLCSMPFGKHMHYLISSEHRRISAINAVDLKEMLHG